MRCTVIVFLVASLGLAAEPAHELRPGVFAGKRMRDLPLPGSGFEAYLVGELHGLAENEQIQVEYLRILAESAGVRDVALEDKGVYQDAAEAYVEGRAVALPRELCLRAGVLQGLRRLNASRRAGAQIRVHLVDVDSPAGAIERHLQAFQERIGANVSIPAAAEIGVKGLDVVARLQQIPMDPVRAAELRTIELSIVALRQGFEVGIGPLKGVPYLDSREEAVALNVRDLIRVRGVGPVLVLYGADHVSRTARKDGGPERNQPFAPMALRLQKAGIRAVSMVTFPLEARAFWRTKRYELPWTARDGNLAGGETLEEAFRMRTGTRFLYVDRKRHAVQLASQDLTRMEVDGYLLFPSGTPMEDRCGR